MHVSAHAKHLIVPTPVYTAATQTTARSGDDTRGKDDGTVQPIGQQPRRTPSGRGNLAADQTEDSAASFDEASTQNAPKVASAVSPAATPAPREQEPSVFDLLDRILAQPGS